MLFRGLGLAGESYSHGVGAHRRRSGDLALGWRFLYTAPVTTLYILGAIIAVNGLCTAWLLRSSAFEPRQRRLQILLLWILPALGTLLVFVNLLTKRRRAPG